jgi:tellurite methyltransferase
MTNKPFWEEQYSKIDGIKTFNDGNPTAEVKKLVNEYLRTGRTVDLGCGAGRDSIFLAKHGFDVTAVDISATGIAKLKKVATESKLIINAEVKDIRVFNFIGEYDLFISMGCLHLIPKSDQSCYLIKLKITPNGTGLILLMFLQMKYLFHMI